MLHWSYFFFFSNRDPFNSFFEDLEHDSFSFCKSSFSQTHSDKSEFDWRQFAPEHFGYLTPARFYHFHVWFDRLIVLHVPIILAVCMLLGPTIFQSRWLCYKMTIVQGEDLYGDEATFCVLSCNDCCITIDQMSSGYFLRRSIMRHQQSNDLVSFFLSIQFKDGPMLCFMYNIVCCFTFSMHQHPVTMEWLFVCFWINHYWSIYLSIFTFKI